MVTSNQITPGMILSVGSKLFRVESSVKVSVTKGTPFIKTKLKNLNTDQVIEKNFKLDQTVKDVALAERTLEFLYIEGKEYLFLDIEGLDAILVPSEVVGNKVDYLKEGVLIHATFYGDTIFAIEMPQFLEIMVSSTEGGGEEGIPVSNATKIAVLETGAKIEVPPFVEAGDIIKVDTRSGEYIQRV